MKRTPLFFLLCLTLFVFGLFHFKSSRAEKGSSSKGLVHDSFSQQSHKLIPASQEIKSSKSARANFERQDLSQSLKIQGTDETFARLITKAQRKGSVRIIVGLKTAFVPEGFFPNARLVEAQREGIAQAQDSLIAQLTAFNVTSITPFTFIPFIAMEIDAAGLTFLQKSSEVSSIEEDLPRPMMLAESVPLIGGTTAWASGFSGAGQTVAILDSGVDKTHSFLSGKVVSEACYSTTNATFTSVCPGGVTQSTSTGSGVNCPMSLNNDCAHGTHVAGIAAGKGTSFSGVAKDASIISIQVFSQPVAGGRLGAFDSNIISGLQRVQQLSGSFNIAAVNMSLGGGLFTANCDGSQPSMKAAIDNLRSIGIATVIASGNNGSATGISSPACISSAISTGSTDDGSLFTIANQVSSFSNSASILNLLAPGNPINSSVPGGGFQNFAGTSMAAPHVAGAWAVLRSKAPSATVAQVLQALTSTGLPVTDSRNGIIKPRIKVDAALNALGLVGHWKFDENAGTTAADSSGSGNTGTLTSGAGWGAGQNSAAVSFDGVDDYVQVGSQSSLVMTNTASFTAWIHPAAPFTSGGIIINKEGEYEIARFSDGTIQCAFANTNPGWNWINTGAVAPLNQWTHVAVVYESGIVKTYINGVLTHTYNGSGAVGDVDNTQNDFRIGGRQAVPHPFQGRIDEVRIYNRAISATEITQLMNN